MIALALALLAGCFDSQGQYASLVGPADCDPSRYETHCSGNVLRYCAPGVQEDCSELDHCPPTTPYVASETCDHVCAIVENTSVTSPDHARCLP